MLWAEKDESLTEGGDLEDGVKWLNMADGGFVASAQPAEGLGFVKGLWEKASLTFLA